MLLASWTFYKVWKGYRSFDAKGLGSVGQRALKLLAVKDPKFLALENPNPFKNCVKILRG